MAIVRWDPFRELNAAQDRMNRLLGDAYRAADDDVMRRGAWAPPVDIYDSGNHELVIKAELPEGFQTAEFMLEHGFVDRIVERKDLRREIARLIDYAGK
jgi:HSP20 family molecular chaperone IbpA